MKRLILVLGVMLCSQISYAETCPSIHDIKNQLTSDWSLYDSEDGRPLSTKQVETFEKNVALFALAEWSGSPERGEIHCYYRDLDGSSLEAYLSKPNSFPDQSAKRWYQVSGHLHCAAGTDKCIFNNHAPRLAHNQ